MVIDLFADSVAILNFNKFEKDYGMPRGHSLSIYVRFSGEKRTSLYISREKGNHYYIQTRHNSMYWYSAHSLSKISILN